MPSSEQLTFSFSAIRNSELLAVHWFENRLPLEPEWQLVQGQMQAFAGDLLKLWSEERERVDRYGNEAGLEHAFIQPVFQLLGWKVRYQPHLQGRAPDYALFSDDEAFDQAHAAGHTNPDFWKYATLVADAKAWHISLDRSIREGSRREYPPEQIEWYLDRSRLDFGILTNGRLWRLIPRELGARKPRFKTYLEIDLPRLLNRLREHFLIGEELKDLTRFFLFFSPIGYSTKNVAQALVQRAIQGSAEYSISVGEDLKERVFEALRFCIQGLLSVEENELDPNRHLRECKCPSSEFLRQRAG
jgi:hypothetical protein